MEDEVGMEWDSPSSPCSSSSSGEDDCSPRIGTEFQVDAIPRCTHNFFAAANVQENGSMSFQQQHNAAMDEVEEAYAMGRPVRITSIRMTNERKQEFGRNPTPERNSGEDEGASNDCTEDADYKESSRNGADGRKRRGKKKRKGNWLTFRRLRSKNISDQLEQVIVPGDSFAGWDDCEEAAFVLGLYLFGKDFNALKRFLETKRVTDLQHYYYGVFYGTAAYKRWVAARNNCSKRIVNGQHILVGWRQEELLRRLLPELEECSRPELFEAMAGFNRGEVSFEKYVSRLKAVAGLELLIDSVGLGCGKRDLTMGSVDSVQNSKKWELPPGKAFSDYTASEMFRAVSGGCRLSKSRAQDLFWEAVWPRLLAKGWSSEQSGKGPLVYMVPGIKRYSKRSLVKGKDYFDSISEVLNHLASDSTLLELAELDNELLAKSQMDTNKRVSNKQHAADSNGEVRGSERKRRPTLWLSKGTSHSFTRESTTPKDTENEEEKKKQENDAGKAQDQGDKNKDDASEEDRKGVKSSGAEDCKDATDGTDRSGITSMLVSSDRMQLEISSRNQMIKNDSTTTTTTTIGTTSQLDLQSNPGGSSCDASTMPCEDSLSSSFTGFGEYQIMPRKRSYYDAFSESSSPLQLEAGVAVSMSTQPGRKAFLLDRMIKHYLGNGKSMRLYGPSTTRLLQHKQDNAYKFLLKGFQEAFYMNQAGVNIADLFLAMHAGKCSVITTIENRIEVVIAEPSAKQPSSTTTTTTSTIPAKSDKLCQLELLEEGNQPAPLVTSGPCEDKVVCGAFICGEEATTCLACCEAPAEEENLPADGKNSKQASIGDEESGQSRLLGFQHKCYQRCRTSRLQQQGGSDGFS